MSRTVASLGNARTRTFYPYILLIWLLIIIAMSAVSAERIATLSMGDPDNYMRLAQVRDWLNGQAWTDVTQYRMNPPRGGDLHWSRLVDMPIALTVLALRPLVGQASAELAALLAVPAFLYLALMMVMARVLRNIAGRGIALALIALLPGCLLVNVQFMPMRIDHHGWQLLMAAIALLAWTRPGAAPAALCGIACAFWMHVSIEGLPYAVLFAGLYALAYVLDGKRGVLAFLLSLCGGTLLFLLVTRGPGLLVEAHCDAVSLPYVVGLLNACATFFLADRLLRPHARPARLLPPLCAGLAALAGLALVEPACLNGPFAHLDPIVRDYWYHSVREGLPFWRQSGPFALMQLFAPLPGVIGAIMAARMARGTPQAMVMLGLALAAIFAWLLGLAVMRASGVAQLYALPGMAAAIASLAAARERFRPRIGWSVSMAAAFLLSTALPAHVAGSALFPAERAKARSARQDQCVGHIAGPVLRALGDELLFGPIDMGPLVLHHTDLSIVAAGYHRNSAAMATVIRAFTARAEQARAIVLATSASHLLLCPNAPEARAYLTRAPQGLAADLARGEVPDWLIPDERLQRPGARLYRIAR